MHILSDVLFDLGSNTFLLPYLRRELGMDDDSPELEPTRAVRIVHRAEPNTPDSDFERVCRDKNLPIVTLVCPNIVGTGMNGLMRKIAASLYRGTFFHIAGNDARTAVIHAIDVARAAALCAGRQGEYVLTDGTEPRIADIAEALSYRLGDKRIFTIKPWMARIWYGRSFREQLTKDTPETSTFAEEFPDFQPNEVITYLRTHTYDDASL